MIPAVDEDPSRGSFGEAIRNRMLSVAIGLPFFASFMPRVTKSLPIDPADLPILACYLGEEISTPDGDLNAGGLAFITTLRLGWSIMVKESDNEEADRRIEKGYVALRHGIFGNPSLTSMLDTTDYETGEQTTYNARFEGFPRQRAVTAGGAFLQDNVTPVAEKQYDLTLQFRTFYTPGPFHDLEEIDVITSFPVHRTEAERERIQQVRQRLLFITQPPQPQP